MNKKDQTQLKKVVLLTLYNVASIVFIILTSVLLYIQF